MVSMSLKNPLAFPEPNDGVIECDDQALLVIVDQARSYSTLCFQELGDIPPHGLFLSEDGQLDFFLPSEKDRDAEPDDLLELVRLEAMSRAISGSLAGAALLARVESSEGDSAVATQIQTASMSLMLLHPCHLDGPNSELGDPVAGPGLLLEEGLCFAPLKPLAPGCRFTRPPYDELLERVRQLDLQSDLDPSD
ncbi:hypothetical protein ACFL5O_05260 [Myxococcota bacterium]